MALSREQAAWRAEGRLFSDGVETFGRSGVRGRETRAQLRQLSLDACTVDYLMEEDPESAAGTNARRFRMKI